MLQLEARLIQDWIAGQIKEDKEKNNTQEILYWFRSNKIQHPVSTIRP